jgi:hypothetical protein
MLVRGTVKEKWRMCRAWSGEELVLSTMETYCPQRRETEKQETLAPKRDETPSVRHLTVLDLMAT